LIAAGRDEFAPYRRAAQEDSVASGLVRGRLRLGCGRDWKTQQKDASTMYEVPEATHFVDRIRSLHCSSLALGPGKSRDDKPPVVFITSVGEITDTGEFLE
jgi:hypothetical protein